MRRIVKTIGCMALILAVIVGIGGGFVIARWAAVATLESLPTEAVLPTHLPPTDTSTPTVTTTSTATFTATQTTTATSTATPSPTSTLATLVIKVTASGGEVVLNPPTEVAVSATPSPLPTVEVPTPANKIEMVPPGDTPLVGWFERDVTDAQLQYTGKWNTFTATYRAANKRYMYTDEDNAALSLRFLGAAVRVRYVAYYSYGVFQIRLDGQVVATIDSYYPKQNDGKGNFLTTAVFGLAHGWHTLEVSRMGRKNPASAGTMIAIDSLDVYFNGLAPTATGTAGPTATPTSSTTPAAAKKIQIVVAPPTVQPTATDRSPTISSVNLSIAYDENSNKAIDPTEGVQGISVRLVEVESNLVVASGVTNNEGFIHLEGTTKGTLRLVVPYLNRFWDVPLNTGTMRITFLVPPVNRPGLIP
jgi:hypothetical protein